MSQFLIDRCGILLGWLKRSESFFNKTIPEGKPNKNSNDQEDFRQKESTERIPTERVDREDFRQKESTKRTPDRERRPIVARRILNIIVVNIVNRYQKG